MSIPTDFRWRGAAACLSEPVTDNNSSNHAEFLVTMLDMINRFPNPTDYIVYRSGDRELDTLRHVFRFDNAPYESVFREGFQARVQANTPERQYGDLEGYVNSGGRPLDSRRDTNYIFISTTLSSSWSPSVDGNNSVTVYRYEIYAPGGIWVAQTLGDRYDHPSQDEVAFIERIDPRYIRSAQRFILTSDGGRLTRRRRADTILYINRNFNPLTQLGSGLLQIQNPVSYYYNIDENRQRRNLEIQEYPEHPESRRRRSLSANDALIEYYTNGVTSVDNYIDSAFRAKKKNEVYIFIRQEYVLINYAPGSADDKIVNGPLFIGNGFPSLVGTAFAEYGIDAAFGCHEDEHEAMIFSGNLCAKINYAPGTTRDRIIEGPKSIRQMFPFFKGTSFELGIDAAFESTKDGEAYLFKGSEYALINYYEPTRVAIRPITDGFRCLRNTEFERDIGAAFASHLENEAYLFKGNSYIRLHFTPGSTGDYIIDARPKEIVPTNWPSLKDFLPRKNSGPDDYLHESSPSLYILCFVIRQRFWGELSICCLLSVRASGEFNKR